VKAENYFDLSGRVAVVTGAGGVLCSVMAEALASSGAAVALLDIKLEAAEAAAEKIRAAGNTAIAVKADVLDRASLVAAEKTVIEQLGRADILVNGAGGNNPKATTNAQTSFFDLPEDAIRWVFELNCLGTILPSQVFGRTMAEQDRGVIINISSMNAFRPLTRIPAYSAAKAAVSNFTQWLAVHMSRSYSTNIRVNAIAPGFFLTEQNRFLLTDKETGELTDRGRTIIDHTPMRAFGQPEDLVGTLLWLVGEGARFVHGVIVPVDGGFSAFSGV